MAGFNKAIIPRTYNVKFWRFAEMECSGDIGGAIAGDKANKMTKLIL